MAEQVHLAEPERLAHRLGLLDIAADRPQRGVGGPVGCAGAELVEGDDAVALVDQAGMRFAQIVARQARAAVQAEHGLAAGAEAVGDDLEAIDIDLDAVVGRDLPPHHVSAACTAFRHAQFLAKRRACVSYKK